MIGKNQSAVSFAIFKRFVSGKTPFSHTEPYNTGAGEPVDAESAILHEFLLR
jgi:hypothetical protein